MANENLLPGVKKLYGEIATSLNQLTAISDPNDPNYLGEPWRTQLLEVKGQINASLEGLPATDQVPAAQEASYGLNCLKSSLLCVQSIITNLNAVIKAKTADAASAKASMPTEIQSAIAAKVTAGELVLKQTATDLAASQRTEGVAEGLARGKKISDRRLALSTAGLPNDVIGSAPEEVLLAEDAIFTGHQTKAKDRVTKLTATGIGLTTASATLIKLTWAKDEEFEAQFKGFEEIARSARGQSNGNSRASGFITPTTTPANGTPVRIPC